MEEHTSHDLPTRVVKVPPEHQAASEPDSSPPRDAAGSIVTPDDALLKAEIGRAHLFYWVSLVATLGIVGLLPMLGGDPALKPLVAGSLLLWIGAYTVFKIQLRDPAAYRDRNLLPGGLAGCFAGVVATYYWGIFSPTPAVIAAALFINSLIGSLRYTLTIYLTFAVGLGGLAVLILTGAVEDRGLISAAGLDQTTVLFTQGLIQFVLFISFISARLSRRGHLEAAEELRRTVRRLAERDALLSEARAELKRTAWVGGPGRFTGQTLGSFLLGDVVGRGAMGEVYQAAHTETGEQAAVKLLQRNVENSRPARDRFAREVRAVAAVRSPHVVSVLEVSDESAPIPYLAMELLEGADLSDLLRRKRRLPPVEAASVVRQIAAGLDAAHAAGIVHRDLKPHNIFGAACDGETVWKILDFGISKLGETSGTLTSGAIVGTPNYMAPEQARGQAVDHRADVYALGAIAYRALTGQPPFVSRVVAVTVYDVVHRMPPRPSALADLAPEIDAVLGIALCKDRAQRFSSARELADALAAAADGRLEKRLADRAVAILAARPWGSTTP